LLSAIPFDSNNLPGSFAFDIHYDEYLCNLQASPTPEKVAFELARVVGTLRVDEPIVVDMSRPKAHY
jgi:hypothetical protein